MKCPDCNSEMKKLEVSVDGAESKAVSFQCPKCSHFEFEGDSAKKVVAELKAKESPLKIKQKVIKMSKDRIGMYFQKDISRCLGLKAGEEILVSVPDKKHLLITLE